ncbi:hypothetical protein IAT40_002603 [Kwoniella sp. CBS 6097]
MPPRSRYAVDPSLSAPSPGQGQYGGSQQPQGDFQQYHQQSQPDYGQQQPYQQHGHDPNYAPQLHPSSDRRSPIPSGPYAPSGPSYQQQQQQQQQPYQQQQQQQQSLHPSYVAPANHIPAPPHSSGPALSGPRVRIDPSQVPNPVEAQELDQNLYDDEEFLSCQTRGLVPLVGTDYRGVDQGNSLPRHLRATLPCMPSNSQLLDTTALPFSLVVQPFASLRYDESPVPCVSNWVSGQSAFDPPSFESQNPEDDGPPRCDKCRGYINPWVRFTDGGRKWTCNLCGNTNPVSPTYFCHLAPNGQRLDHADRPELQFGTVDFSVGRSYWALQPPPSGSLLDVAADASSSATDALSSTAADLLGGLQASLGQDKQPIRGPSPQPNFKEREKQRKEEERKYRRPGALSRVFVIDISAPSAARAIVREVCEAIRKGLYGSKKEGETSGDENEEDELVIGRGERIGIITYAESVGFWNLSPGLPAPAQMVVSDLDDMFIPFTTGFLVDPVESRTQIEALLDLLPTMAERGMEGNRVAAGSAVKGALAGLRLIGGQVNLFLSGLLTHGAGALQPREDPTVYNTDKEKALFSPASSFWREISDELAEAGVGVNIFMFPEVYSDIASVGAMSATTGGEVFFHPKFQPVRDRDTLQNEIKSIITRETAYNAMSRTRCSVGLRVSDHLGNFYQRAATDLEFGALDSQKSFVAVLKHEGRLDDRQPAYVQVATLYTSSSGERRVRCLNMSFVVTSMIGNVFKFADQEAGIAVLLKGAISQMPTRPLREIKKALSDRCNRVLLMYRRHCAPAVQQGQLILPEGYKLLPLYTLCMLKSKPLKGGNVTSDVRVHYMRHLKSLSATRTLNLLYPRLLAIHDLADDVGFPDGKGRLKLPTFMRASYGWMVAEGAYLLTNGEVAMVWFGGAVNPQIVDDLFGVDNLQDIDVRMTRLPKLPTLLSTQLRNIITHLERIIDHSLPVLIVRQNMDGMEIEFANQLVEDSNNDAHSYTDYLMTAHKAITNDLSGSGAKGDSWKPW